MCSNYRRVTSVGRLKADVAERPEVERSFLFESAAYAADAPASRITSAN
jgi:hypothetical protein